MWIKGIKGNDFIFFSFWLLKVDNYNRTSKKEKYRLKLCDGEIIIHCGCRLNGPNSSTQKNNNKYKNKIRNLNHWTHFCQIGYYRTPFWTCKKNALSSWEQNGDQTSANGGPGFRTKPGTQFANTIWSRNLQILKI